MRNRKRKKNLGLLIGFIILVIGILAFTKFLTISSVLFQVVVNKKIELKREDDHINLLLLGRGGGTHEGPNLTDTIIFVSMDTKNQKITMVSLPRDLWEPDLEGVNKKINGAYAQGEDKRPGGGLVETKSIVGKVVGQPIDYGIVVDFSGFVKAVDMLGGIDVKVDRTFDDYEYPIEGNETELCGHSEDDVKAFSATDSASPTFDQDQLQYFSCRYKHLHFDEGLNHMDGETALEFVRSRHAAGIEGSDFARSQRQEKVIKAIKDKVFSLGTILNPAKVLGLYNTLKSSIDTDIPQSQFDDFIKLAQKMKSAPINSTVIDTGDARANRPGLLVQAPISPEFDNLFVLIPKLGNGNFSQIQKYISCQIQGNCSSPTPAPKK